MIIINELVPTTGCSLYNTISPLFALRRNDKRFFIKTQSRSEVSFLLSNLEKYAAHLEKCPHSLLVRFLGEKTAHCRAY